MEIKWLKRALFNLEKEAEFIAKDDPEAAKHVVQQILNSVLLLADNPSLGHVGRINSTRELVIPKLRYIVPYRVRPSLQQIEILCVFHTSRKLPNRW